MYNSDIFIGHANIHTTIVCELISLENDDTGLLTKLKTPLLYAIKFSNHEAAELLLRYGADPNFKGSPAIHPHCIDAMPPVNYKTPLLYAIELSNDKAVELLLEYGADPNFIGDGEETPLEAARRRRHDASSVKSPERDKRDAIIEMLKDI